MTQLNLKHELSKAAVAFADALLDDFDHDGHPACPDPDCESIENEKHSKDCRFWKYRRLKKRLERTHGEKQNS